MKSKPTYPSKMLKGYWIIPAFVSIFIIILSTTLVSSYVNGDASNHIYFAKDDSIWRISSSSNAMPELLAEMETINQSTQFVRSGDNLIYLTDSELEIRQINLSTGEDSLVLNCYEIALGGNCLAFDLQVDTNEIVYNFEYYSSDAPLGLFQIRLFNLDNNTDEAVLEIQSRLYRIRWINNHQIEYTTPNGEWWEFDLYTEEHNQIEYESNTIYSPDRRYYARWEFNSSNPRLLYQYDFYLSDGTPFHDQTIEISTEANQNQITWRPDSSGILYHELHTPIGMPINRLTYYDLFNNEKKVILEVSNERFDNNAFVIATWSSDGQYILINSSRGLFIYDMQSLLITELDIELDFIIGWYLSSNASRHWLSFPAG